MRKTNLVKKIVGTFMEEHGFQYRGYAGKGWSFTREKDEFTQTVMIDDLYSDSLRLTFRTNAYQYPTRYANELIPKEEYTGNIQGAWEYETEDDIIRILEGFCEIILKYGFKALEEMSCHWTEVRPTEIMNRYLFENHEQLKKQYCEKYAITVQAKPKKVLGQIQEILIREQGKSFAEVKDLLIGLAAIYGTTIQKYFKGQWQWRESSNKICVVGNLGEFNSIDYVLSRIISHWRDNPDELVEYSMRDIEYWESQ